MIGYQNLKIILTTFKERVILPKFSIDIFLIFILKILKNTFKIRQIYCVENILFQKKSGRGFLKQYETIIIHF